MSKLQKFYIKNEEPSHNNIHQNHFLDLQPTIIKYMYMHEHKYTAKCMHSYLYKWTGSYIHRHNSSQNKHITSVLGVKSNEEEPS